MKKNTYFPSKRSFVESFKVMDVLSEAKYLERKKKIFHLELGEPLSNTPPEVKKEAQRLIDTSLPGYTPSNGVFELRKRISIYYKSKNNLDIDPDRIFVTTGSSGAFLLTFLACFDVGDKVAIFNPVYPAYRNILKALGLNVIEIPADVKNNYKISLEKIDHYKSIKGVILSNPNNPTGQIFNKKELDFLYTYCKKNKIVLISDEIYHGIEYERKTYPILSFGNKAIIINSFSKFFCMPGWRLGWTVIPKELKENFLKLSQNLFISSNNIAQYSAIKIFDCLDQLVANVDNYKLGRDIVMKELSKVDVLSFSIPHGAFYFYINIQKTKMESTKLVKKILKETGVALTPGADFDKITGERSIRLSFSSDFRIVQDAVEKLSKWFKENY